MTSIRKLKTLAMAAKFDTCGLPSSIEDRIKDSRRGRPEESVIYPSIISPGRCVNLFKILQSNICEKNCLYCANRAGRRCERWIFSPQELATTFMEYYKRNYVEGLFLSSAIYKGPDYTQEQMLKTVKLLRYKYHYPGYIHFVILPGVRRSLIEEAASVADRLSINLEAPTKNYLAKLAPRKEFFKEILRPLEDIAKIDREKPLRAGITTQFVIGAAGEADKEILDAANKLYRNYRLWRAYYSGFSPVKQTPLEDRSPCPSIREVRLYQADFLLRKYGFGPSEFVFDKNGDLSQDKDPKLAWAQAHLDKFPIEINKASFWQLIRIPGIGRISAKRILEVRKKTKIRNLEQLKKMGVAIRRATNFLALDGKSPHPAKEPISTTLNKQLFFWEEL